MLKNTRQLVILALLITQALVLSVIESWIPVPIAIPGVKLGLANIVTLITIIFLGYREAILVVALRCFLVSLFGGGPVLFLFSISGGILSTIIMAALYKRMRRIFSIIGISIAGSIMHNIGQIGAASIVMKDVSVLTYLPVLLISGVIMGFFVGVCSNLLIKALEKTRLFM